MTDPTVIRAARLASQHVEDGLNPPLAIALAMAEAGTDDEKAVIDYLAMWSTASKAFDAR